MILTLYVLADAASPRYVLEITDIALIPMIPLIARFVWFGSAPSKSVVAS